MYHYDGAWHVATSGTPDACGEVHDSEWRFADYFWDTFKAQGGTLPGPGREDLCFAFELMGPLNRIVVVYDKPWLRLLAVRERLTGIELDPNVYSVDVNVPAVRSFALNSIQQIVESFEHISPVSQEGYIVVDGEHRRIKIKHPLYVALHHAKDGMGPKAFAEIARTGEVPEVIAAFPEFETMLQEARDKYTTFINTIETDYEKLKHIETQKDFACEALKTRYSAVLFQIRKGKNPREFIKNVPIDTFMTWIGM